ncbi:MAG TPA: four helix bundle protein [Pyrinomonadaceae bacterium]|nr:four helix bundle protein [Pyrinomonadaceae bacterium]
MATFKRFEDIDAWQSARALTRKIYKITREGPFARDFGLKDQIRDASVSMMSNIAEGFERSGTGEFGQFLAIAKGSAGEVRSELYVALDQEYITQNVFQALSTEAERISKMISNLMGYLRNSPFKGTKFKKASD